MKYLFGLFVFAACATNPVGLAGAPIQNYQIVEPGFSRGASPGPAGVAWLKHQGFKTIVDVDNDDDANRIEAAAAKAAGITDVQIPLSGFFKPKDSNTNAVQVLLRDLSRRPIFLHCAHGSDRTGLMAGIYRVEMEKWKVKDAHEEMLKYGFHTLLFPLEHYYWEREEGRP